MLLIEFCGTPGCGKTTLCDTLEEELVKQGFRVKNLQKKKLPKTIWDRLAQRLFTYRCRFFLPNKMLKEALSSISPCLQENSLINWQDRILESNYRIQKAEKAGIEIGLFDEGFIQFITSIYHDKRVESDSKILSDKICEDIYRDRTLLIDCHMEIRENYSRLLERNKENDRFLANDDKGNMTLIKRKRDNINIVLGMVQPQNLIILNMSKTDNDLSDILTEIHKMKQ